MMDLGCLPPASLDRTVRAAVYPSITGISRSMRMQSYGLSTEDTFSTASRPFFAADISQVFQHSQSATMPTCLSWRRRTVRLMRLSSTTSTRVSIPGCFDIGVLGMSSRRSSSCIGVVVSAGVRGVPPAVVRMKNRNSDPFPYTLATSIWPPIFWASLRQTKRPRPLPPNTVWVIGDAWENRWNSFCSSAGLSPGPVSATIVSLIYATPTRHGDIDWGTCRDICYWTSASVRRSPQTAAFLWRV